MGIVASGSISIIDMNDSKQLVSYIGSSQSKTVIYDPNTKVYVPNYTTTNQVLTPQLFVAGTSTDIANQAKSIRWFYQVNSGGTLTEITTANQGTTYLLGTGDVKTLTIKENVLSSNVSMAYICEIVYTDSDTGFDVRTKSDIELVKITNGQRGNDGANGANAIMAVLTNESHVVPTDSAGNNGNYTGANTKCVIYEGTTDVSALWNVTATPSSGVTGTLSDKTYTVTNMTVDSGYVDIVAKKDSTTITKRFNLSKSKQGTAGTNGTTPTAYWLISSTPAISKSKNGVMAPSSLTITSKSQKGTASPTAYDGRFIISESTDGINFTSKYTSSANESSIVYPSSGSLSSTVKALKVQLYLAGGTSNLLDEEIIRVVTDGSDGVNSVVATVWTPDGNTIKNSSGTLTAQIDVFSGASKVTPSAFKWYIQDPSATTTSGGDTDGGNGWRLLNATYNAGVTGYTTAKITIPSSAISSVESFMCVATYSGNKYRDVCTVIDTQDPIAVVITGLNTFKNGQGSSEFTARLYRNGAEIDSGGTEFAYTWSLYNSDNTLNTAFGSPTGKKITVNATSVDVRANLICEVSK
mgnify:CR=1 FL=1